MGEGNAVEPESAGEGKAQPKKKRKKDKKPLKGALSFGDDDDTPCES